MTEEERKSLLNLLLDGSILERLDKWTSQTNIFEILKTTNQEIRHSNILAWLMDPNENHGIGDGFLREFIASSIKAYNEQKKEAVQEGIIEILLQDYYSYQVMREANHMDLLLYSDNEKTVIVIENKIWAGETGNQLETYRKQVEIDYQGYKKLFMFLTPHGDTPSDTNWIIISYQEILGILENIISNCSLNSIVELILKNYADIIRRKIIMEKDPELERLCLEIYNKHRSALKLIYDNVPINNSVETYIISKTLNDYDKNGRIIHNGESSWSFFTKEMDAFLPKLPGNDSSWKTNWVYYYWFNIENSKLCIHFELGGAGLDNKLRERENAIIRACNKIPNEFVFKRLYYKSEKLPNADDEQYELKLENAVKKLIDGALANEEKILKGAENILKVDSAIK